jgi:hypothetical protein
MARSVLLGAALAVTAFGSATQAQFRLDYAPSSFNAAPKANIDRIDTNRLHALSPLGGKQGTPMTIQTFVPAAPVGTYVAPTASAGLPPIGGVPKASDPSVDDPNKPRQALRPNSIKSGVAPR